MWSTTQLLWNFGYLVPMVISWLLLLSPAFCDYSRKALQVYTVKDFVSPMLYCFIPCLNVIVVFVVILELTSYRFRAILAKSINKEESCK